GFLGLRAAVLVAVARGPARRRRPGDGLGDRTARESLGTTAAVPRPPGPAALRLRGRHGGMPMRRSAQALLATVVLLALFSVGCADGANRAESRARKAKATAQAKQKVVPPEPAEAPKPLAAVPPAPPPPVKPRDDTGPVWEINGWGRDLPEAEEHALRVARGKIEAYLHRQ